MFERFTEKARRVIFFARYEALQFGSPSIDTEHLLLALLREDHSIVFRFRLSPGSIRSQIENATVVREKVSASVALPLSDECKRVLGYAAEEAEKTGHKHIGPEHFLLGLLREEGSFAAELLRDAGLSIKDARKQIGDSTEKFSGGGVGVGHASVLLLGWSLLKTNSPSPFRSSPLFCRAQARRSSLSSAMA